METLIGILMLLVMSWFVYMGTHIQEEHRQKKHMR